MKLPKKYQGITPGEWEKVSAQRGFIITAKSKIYDVAVVRDIGNEDNNANATIMADAPRLAAAVVEDRAAMKVAAWVLSSYHPKAHEEGLLRCHCDIANAWRRIIDRLEDSSEWAE